MEKAKLWKVKFGTMTSIIVNASNAKTAIDRAMKKEPWGAPRLCEITEVEWLATED